MIKKTMGFFQWKFKNLNFKLINIKANQILYHLDFKQKVQYYKYKRSSAIRTKLYFKNQATICNRDVSL